MGSFKPFVIGVAGGSGSGKTTLVNKVLTQVDPRDIVVIQHDWYYNHLPHMSFEERSRINFDHPGALETTLLVSQLRTLMRGHPVNAPQYDFTRHLRKSTPLTIKPKK